MQKDKSPTLALMLGAAGVVFGDIGTSPLYAFRESFIGHHKLPLDAFHVLGVLSMLFWALILVVTVKYVFVTMRADNRGEGGSFALLALTRRVAKGSRAALDRRRGDDRDRAVLWRRRHHAGGLDHVGG